MTIHVSGVTEEQESWGSIKERGLQTAFATEHTNEGDSHQSWPGCNFHISTATNFPPALKYDSTILCKVFAIAKILFNPRYIVGEFFD